MKENTLNIGSLLTEIESLKSQLFDANSIIDAIKEGSVDALVLQKNGEPHIYSIESADYTYRILIEKFSEGALSITHEGLILYCNDYFAKLIDIPADRITGTFFINYLERPEDYNELMRGIKACGAGKAEIRLNIHGHKIPVFVSFTDLQPKVASIGVVVTDLTDTKKHEAALVKYQNQLESKVNELNTSNKNLEQFIHVISHDIKEPLRKILIYTSRLSSANSDLFDEMELKHLQVINASALRLNSLVDDLVKYSMSADKDDVAEIDLHEVLADVMDDMELVIVENNAEIDSAALPSIFASRVQMRQIFSNLISNAIKYCKSGTAPKIRISHTVTTEEVNQSGNHQFHKISFKDNGIGMDQIHLEKIFTIFQRLHLKHEYSGNGIGLAICKKIMENHAGRIEVESQLDEGSTFMLYFPVNPQ